MHSLGLQRSALVLFSMRTLQENETLERYYTTIHLAVYSAVERTTLLLHYCRTSSSVGSSGVPTFAVSLLVKFSSFSLVQRNKKRHGMKPGALHAGDRRRETWRNAPQCTTGRG